MNRILLFLSLALAAAAPLVAATADLQAVVTAPSEATVGEVNWLARVHNNGPDTATGVTLTSSLYRGSLPVGSECHGSIDSLPPGAEHEITCSGTTTSEWPYMVTVRAAVASETPDPELFNNDYRTNMRIVTSPDLYVHAYTNPIDPGLPFDLHVNVGNLAYSEAEGAVLSVEVPRTAGFVDLPDICTAVDETSVRCELDPLPPWIGPGNTSTLTLRLIAPDDPSGSDLTIVSTVGIDSEDPQPVNNVHRLEALMFRTFTVTTTADAGEGSLRSAIESASSTCGPEMLCKIAFRIDDSSRSWHTIELESPLPAVRGYDVRVDGTTQTRFFGNSNPAGPEVELTGVRIEDPVDGLVIQTSCSGEVAGLTVNGFGGAGVRASGTWECAELLVLPVHAVRDCFIGTDPTGGRAIPNRRGIVVDFRSPAMGQLTAVYEIHDNLVSGNTRSGVMSLAGTRNIRGNIIGINGRLDGDLGNGASGVYIGPDSDGTDLSGNYIGFNHDFGIAIAREALWVAVHGNSIQANWQGGIDRGLDGVTTVIGTVDPLSVPVITGAWWDDSRGVTVIEGAVPEIPRTFGQNSVNLYANDAPDPSGYGEGQYFLAEVYVREDGSFRLEAASDLRGKWIAATVTLRHYVGFAKPVTGRAFDQGFTSFSSEFGPVMQVQ